MGSRRSDQHGPLAAWGGELRHYREAAGMTQEQLAARLRYSRQTITAVELGTLSPSPELATRAEAVLDTRGALTRLYERLVECAAFPAWFLEWHDAEKSATSLRIFQALIIPGLLQTEEYARALLHENDAAVAARMARQKILNRETPEPPVLRCVIDEGVLLRPIGTQETMRAQLEALISAISPRLSIQVVPMGAHPGIRGSFNIASFADDDDVAYLETAAYGHVVTRRKDVAEVASVFEAIRTEALPQRASIEIIQRTAKERWT